MKLDLTDIGLLPVLPVHEPALSFRRARPEDPDACWAAWLAFWLGYERYGLTTGCAVTWPG